MTVPLKIEACIFIRKEFRLRYKLKTLLEAEVCNLEYQVFLKDKDFK